MDNIVFDELERISLKKEVFLKLSLIRKYVYSEDNFKKLIKRLNDIHSQPIERILDAISWTNNDLVAEYGQRIKEEPTLVYYSSVLWEWLYLLAYYIHSVDEDPLWLENFLPHMREFQIRQVAIDEMKKGELLIDQYIDRREKVLETQEQLGQSVSERTQLLTRIHDYEKLVAQKDLRIKELEEQLKNNQSTSVSEPTEQELVETFSYSFRQKPGYRMLIDYLIKEANNASNIEWARHALAIYSNKPSVLINKPADFKTWLVNFCKLFKREWVRDYEPNKLNKVKGKRANKSGVTKFLPAN